MDFKNRNQTCSYGFHGCMQWLYLVMKALWILNMYTAIVNSLYKIILGSWNTSDAGRSFRKIHTQLQHCFAPFVSQLCLGFSLNWRSLMNDVVVILMCCFWTPPENVSQFKGSQRKREKCLCPLNCLEGFSVKQTHKMLSVI